MKAFLSNFKDLLNNIVIAIINLLPNTPFHVGRLPSALDDIMGYVNYYIPFNEMLVTASAWLACMLVFFSYQMILRATNAIQ